MIIVSDTSPVSNLILIQRLDILQKLSIFKDGKTGGNPAVMEGAVINQLC